MSGLQSWQYYYVANMLWERGRLALSTATKQALIAYFVISGIKSIKTEYQLSVCSGARNEYLVSQDDSQLNPRQKPLKNPLYNRL